MVNKYFCHTWMSFASCISQMTDFKKVLLVIFGGICIASKVSATVSACVENRTESCIQNLATFITLDKPRFAGETELERLCRDAEDGQKCSSDFLRSSSCINSDDQLLISLQIGQSQGVSQLLCSSGGYITDPVFRKLYLQHESCIDEHQRKIKECHVSSGIMDNPELEIVRNSSKSAQEKHVEVCCPLVQYIECSENAIETSCGNESKEVVQRVLLKAAGKQLQDFCLRVDPQFPNSPTACISSAIQLAVSLSTHSVMYFAMLVVLHTLM